MLFQVFTKQESTGRQRCTSTISMMVLIVWSSRFPTIQAKLELLQLRSFEYIRDELLMTTLEEYARMVQDKNCASCDKPLAVGHNRVVRVEFYDHDGGWEVEGFYRLQWLYVTCRRCGYENALWKLGVPRNLTQEVKTQMKKGKCKDCGKIKLISLRKLCKDCAIKRMQKNYEARKKLHGKLRVAAVESGVGEQHENRPVRPNLCSTESGI